MTLLIIGIKVYLIISEIKIRDLEEKFHRLKEYFEIYLEVILIDNKSYNIRKASIFNLNLLRAI